MKIMVPIDFTPTTENALKYAIGLSDTLNVKNIVLFHVVASMNEASTAKNNLEQLIHFLTGHRFVHNHKQPPGHHKFRMTEKYNRTLCNEK